MNYGKSLAENSTLEYLNISWNRLRHKGIGLFMKFLQTNIRLRTLNLSWNGFGLYAAKVFGDCMKINSTLEEINYANNQITTEAATHIVRGLSKN
ncbi:unnamed protein product, partial [Didymodactylos carnosus]